MLQQLLRLVGWNVLCDFMGWGDHADRKHYGLLAEFSNTQTLYTACEGVRDAGYDRWDAHTPFPVHGLEKAMGLKESKVPWISLVAGLSGATFGFFMQYWIHGGSTGALEELIGLPNYPLVISGKPFFAWPTYIPITFELGVLLAAIGAVLGWIGLNELPRLHHSLFHSKRFARVTDDKFFIAIESIDPAYDLDDTAALLKKLGAEHVELVER
jgi:hypothetical protein